MMGPVRVGIAMAACALAVVAACGTDSGGSAGEISAAAADLVSSPATVPSPRALGQAAMDAVPGPVMIAVLRDGGAVASLVPDGGSSRRFVTWTTAQGQSLTFAGGVLTASRGLGDDLMSSEVAGVRRLVTAGASGEATRIMRHLGREETTRVTTLACRITREGGESIRLASGQTLAATALVERCEGASGPVENRYWLDAKAVVRKSRQWVSPGVGHVEIDVLRP